MTAKGIYNKLTEAGMTAAGACGLMGNLYAESGLKFNALERLCIKRLAEAGVGDYTDETYTAAVDSGKISRAEFLNPLPGKKYGYGLCQWTTPVRKAGLYDLTKGRGVSIADPEAQIDWLLLEFQSTYTAVWKVLIRTGNVREASDAVLDKFERPADRSEPVRRKRAGYGQKYLDEFSVSEESGMNEVEKLIEVAKGELGYLEKKNGNDLYDKTANAGSANYTKYNYEMHKLKPAVMDYPAAWCAAFVCWCFMQAFGQARAEELLHGFEDYTPSAASQFKKKGQWQTKNPQAGDIIYFTNGTRICHTGIVTGADGQTVYTIEGNTSDGSEVITNGGAVCAKSYANSNSRIAGYGRPAYKVEYEETRIAGMVEITADLNIRETPDGAITGIYHAGEQAGISAKSGKWFQTEKGWISRNYCRGWIQEPGDRWWYIDNGAFPVLTVKEIGGNEYAFDRDGWMITADRLGDGGEIIY